MIRFLNLRLKNFLLFEDLEIEFSKDSNKPVTVIRGENETGKTTLFRAFQWTIFGKESLQRLDPEKDHAFRPVWLLGEPGPETTEATLLFEVERDEGGLPMRWQVVRKAITDYSPESGYTDDEIELSIQNEIDGTFQPANKNNIDIIVARYFPADTRGFYFVDADEADQFVGGGLATFDVSKMRRSVTRSLHQLLGLKTLNDSKERLKQMAATRTRELSRLVDDERINELQDNVNGLAVEQKRLEDARATCAEGLDEAKEKVVEYRSRLAGLGEQQDELAGLNKAVEDAQGVYSGLSSDEAGANTHLGTLLKSEELYASLMKPLLDEVVGTLTPMRVDGVLPPHEVGLLPKLLEDKMCVCGRPLDDDHLEAREHVEERLKVSKEFAESHEYLHKVLTSVERQASLSHQNWAHLASQVMDGARGAYDDAREAWEDLQTAKEARKNFGLDTSEVSIAENIEGFTTWEDLLSQREEDLRGLDKDLETNTSDSRSASEKLRIAQRSNAELGPAQHELTVTQRLHDIVDEVGKRIESNQIPAVSDQCNHIFRTVIQATDRSHFSEVGVEPIHLAAGTQYGLYAKDGNGGPKAIKTANGASRRALAVAYVLALTEVTGSRVPFVADSLLHALSGNVKLSTIQYLVDGERIEQPIIFCTRDDVSDPAVAHLLQAHTGSTYTVTTQTRVVQDGLGDVARADPRTTNDVCSVICGCSILEFCEVCEVVGDPERGDLVQRAN